MGYETQGVALGWHAAALAAASAEEAGFLAGFWQFGM
jgi:hypothetical protein